VETARGHRSNARKGGRRFAVLIGGLALAIVASGCLPAPPLGIVNAQQAAAPQYPVLSDPAVLADGGKYYIYGSNTAQNRMPVHVVSNLTTVYSDSQWFNTRIEGMPTKPAWALDDGVFWAPTVAKVGDTYVAFFAANRPNPPQPWNAQCIGRATSSSPTGPFVAEPGPFSCGLNGTGGALDPFLFHDPSGKWFLYAAFGDTDAPIRVFELNQNADAPRGAFGLAFPYGWAVYGRHFPWEGNFIENPSMLYDPQSKTYLLAYSGGGDWFGPDYATGVARCSAPDGQCTGQQWGPWLHKSNGRTGTGGLSFFLKEDGTPMAIYASFAAGTEGIVSRAGTVAFVSFGNWEPTLGPP
jgi:hypothetical protein